VLVHFHRNLHASLCLNDPAVTHLLFIDADRAFEPSLVLRMLAFDRPVQGVLYPKRNANLTSVGQRQLNVVDGFLGVESGFAQAGYAGTGVMLLQRTVLEQIRDRYPDLYLPDGDADYAAASCSGPVLQAFAPAPCQKASSLAGTLRSAVVGPKAAAARSGRT
jgi:hypothetical protein